MLLLLQVLAQLDDVLDDQALVRASVGACVASKGDIIYERNSGRLLIPASVQKLATCAYALERLGPDYRPATKFWKEGTRLFVHAPGDPSLTYSQLSGVKKRLGLAKVGSVMVRQAYSPGYAPGWEFDDLAEPYAAPISALSVDRGVLELWATGASIQLRPANFGIKVIRGSGTPAVRYDPIAKRVVVSASPSPARKLDTLTLPEPDKAAALAIGGQMATARTLPKRAPDLVIRGLPVSALVKECLEESENHFAEHLLLMSAATEGPLGSKEYEVAQKRIRTFLEREVGLAKGSWLPEDGSGLSRHNLATAEAICMLLEWAASRPWAQMYRNALARPGRGTLASRLQGSALRAKTGTLNRVHALAGYAPVDGGSEAAFAVLVNNAEAENKQIRGLLDDFVRRLEGQAPLGMIFASYDLRESRHSIPRTPAFATDRLCRPGGHCMAPCIRAHRGNESSDETPDRTQRVALRRR